MSNSALSAAPIHVEEVAEIEGLQIGLILDQPRPAELFREYVDLAVVSDYVGFSVFSRMVDPGSAGNDDFLPSEWLDQIRSRFGGRAKDPTPLLALRPAERFRGPSIEKHCSLVYLGTFDRRYVRKFLMFVPSLIDEQQQIVEARAIDYADAALCVAAFTRSRSIYFGGFGRPDGSFEDDTITRVVARLHRMRELLRLPPVHLYFKYYEFAPQKRLKALAERLYEWTRPEPAPESATALSAEL
jgi:hypothetical protein